MTASAPASQAAPRPTPRPFGDRLRQWRERRRLSQLELAAEAQVSTRHLSFVETGRALPSRELVLRLVERLQVPLRERNALLAAAGYAPMYRERSLDDPELAAARQAVDLILRSHEPFPALAVDRHWNLLAANAMVGHLLARVHPPLLRPPVNVLRLSLHPQGLAPDIVNFMQWRGHLFERLRQQIDATADEILVRLLDELHSYPAPATASAMRLDGEHQGVAVPLRLRTPRGILGFIGTTTVFGTPVDVTLQELALETFFPADAITAQVLRELASA